MEKEEWHKRYKEYMLELGVPEKEAEAALQAGRGNYDYASDPKMSASDELSYWASDGAGHARHSVTHEI